MMRTRLRVLTGVLFVASVLSSSTHAETVSTPDPASLSRLHDIVVPEAVDPWWPLAPGWYLVAALAVGVVAWGVWRVRQRRQAGRYRREALAELRALRRLAPGQREAAAGLMTLLKRTALAAWPRTEVAALSGEAWWRFLDENGGGKRFGGGLGELAEQLVYAKHGGKFTGRDLRRLYKAVRQWIQRHRPPVSLPGGQSNAGVDRAVDVGQAEG